VGTADPYLSLVVTARNDDHGGNLLGRMQAFVNGWLNQARRFGIPSELIIVEWNPPSDRPRLAQALRWPPEPGPCTVRIIEVPPELHARYPHGAALPLYQMIGKNVGIRRARGQFVLATNVDILFSSELCAYLAERRLDPGRMYRMDRHDAMADVPVDAGPDEQLAYCRDHVIRLNRREGTFAVNQSPSPVPDSPSTVNGSASPVPVPDSLSFDVVSPDSGICFGEGWYPPERYADRDVFRWSSGRSELFFTHHPAGTEELVLELGPGPGTGGQPLDLEIAVQGESVARLRIAARSRLYIGREWAANDRLSFVVHGNLVPANRDPRLLPFCILGVEWRAPRWPKSAMPYVKLRGLSLLRKLTVTARDINHLVRKLSTGGPIVDLTIAVSPRLRRLCRAYVDRMGFQPLPSQPQPSAHQQEEPISAAQEPTAAAQEPTAPVFLHTNGCGDFTLLARERWFDLRAYPEFDLFSMNLDSVFCYAAHHGGAEEEVLAEPMRIYHIEHGSGSGWTPEGQAKLFQRIAALGLSYVDSETVLKWGAQMRTLSSPMIFNREDWGLAGFDLPETVIPAG